jgi:hypothetical protein
MDKECNIARQRSMASVFITMVIVLAMIVIAEGILGLDSTTIIVTLAVFSILVPTAMWIWPGCGEDD